MNKRSLTKVVLSACCLAAVATTLTAPAEARPVAQEVTHTTATKPKTVEVRGRQIPVNPPLEYTMRGGLIGDWTITPVTVLHNVDTLYVESGTELFSGCLDRNKSRSCDPKEPAGELTFSYLYWASFNAGGLIKGQCVHPVTGGNGSFTGARGLLTMYDRPVGDEVRTRYEGEIILNAVNEPPTGEPTTLRTTASAASTRRAGC
ncbi:MAG TPA: hypothetical protein VIT20_00890 [Propionibacteriaceae bacterium]